jgi:dihydrofolate reductase
MKKVILDLAITLDGYIEGPNGEIDWCILDDDMELDKFISGVDTIFYGRVSYDAWGNFQPDTTASETEKSIWTAVHSKKKIVFSGHQRTDTNAEFITTNLAGRVAEIKAQSGKDIWLYGGAGLIRTFIELNLIDVYRLSVHPIALGSGKPLFENIADRIKLKLTDVRRFKSGVVQLIYEPQR